MLLRKPVLSLLAGVLSASIITGGQGQGGASELIVSQESELNVDNRLELDSDPVNKFFFPEGKGRIFAINGPAADRDFAFRGKRMIYAHGAVFRHGEEYRPSGADCDEELLDSLYRFPIENGSIKARWEIESSKGTGTHERNLTVCKDYVLFERSEDGTMWIYDGKKAYGGKVPWKEAYNGMVGTAEGELLLVKQPDTICVARLEGMEIGEPQEIIAHAGIYVGKPETVMRPVYLDKDELFVSMPAKDGGEALASFSRDGELIMIYDEVDIETSDWAVTDNYVLAAGSTGLAIYERRSGVAVLTDETTKDFHAVLLHALGGDRVLFYGICENGMFGVIELEPTPEPTHIVF